MLRSTSKEFKQAVRKFIVENIGDEYQADTEKESINNVYAAFKSEYLFPANLRRYGSEFNCFTEWLRGLPSALSVAFTYYEERELMKNWFQQTDAESEKYSDEKVDSNYWYYITREFFALVK
jgi:hypothetical protein